MLNQSLDSFNDQMVFLQTADSLSTTPKYDPQDPKAKAAIASVEAFRKQLEDNNGPINFL